ncbi:hypothetical protein [Janthinobacterium agaricidamnosum]|uniref:hypothetical protein n=1 Tax=Janthinobacterium agaricidamnosum TaxID=55508 RepID=UPI0013CE9E28|nr:hypothetical protein [Janthinobacterium agaricidamnosum]
MNNLEENKEGNQAIPFADDAILVAPRRADHAIKPGAYQLATRVTSNVIDPGDFFEFDQFITGYGDIKGSKILGYVSTSVFDGAKSEVIHSFGKDEKGLYFGGLKTAIDASGFSCNIAGIKDVTWTESTSYFDINSCGCPTISTESEIRQAPLSYKLKLQNNVRPGEYAIDFYFTYFNGEKWQCGKESVKLKVRNFFERHSGKLSLFGVVATCGGLILGVARLVI